MIEPNTEDRVEAERIKKEYLKIGFLFPEKKDLLY